MKQLLFRFASWLKRKTCDHSTRGLSLTCESCGEWLGAPAADGAPSLSPQDEKRLAAWGAVSDAWQRYKELKRDGKLPMRAAPTIDDWTTDYAGVRLTDAAAGQPGGLWRVKPGQERPLTQPEYEALPKKEPTP